LTGLHQNAHTISQTSTCPTLDPSRRLESTHIPTCTHQHACTHHTASPVFDAPATAGLVQLQHVHTPQHTASPVSDAPTVAAPVQLQHENTNTHTASPVFDAPAATAPVQLQHMHTPTRTQPALFLTHLQPQGLCKFSTCTHQHAHSQPCF